MRHLIRFRRGAALMLLGLALASLSSCGQGSAAKEPASSPVARRDRFTEARGLFRQMCAGCHTLADAGTHGKRFNLDKESPLVLFLVTPADRRALARESIVGGADGMPSWGEVLSQREIDELVEYVISVVKDENVKALR